MWYDNVAKENVKGSLLTLISLKNKEDIKRYAESVDDPDVKECVDRLMILNENTIKSFWNLTPEQENRMMQNTREKLIREKSEKRGLQKGKNIGLAEGKISIARNMINMNIGKDIIKSATGLSEEEIEKIVLSAIDEIKPTSMKDMGLVMKKVGELLVGKNADMSLVSKLVKEKIMSN